jgi:hypothetical protein
MSREDKLLEMLETYKRRAVALFALVTLVFAMVAIVAVEISAVTKVWNIELPNLEPSWSPLWWTAGVTALLSVVGWASKSFARFVRALSRKRRVFVAYPAALSSLGRDISTALRAAGAKVWVAEEHLRPGDSILARVQSAIANSDVLVCLLSSNQTRYIAKEIQIAIEHQVKIIPVLVQANAEVPDALTDITFIDYEAKPKDVFLSELVAATR